MPIAPGDATIGGGNPDVITRGASPTGGGSVTGPNLTGGQDWGSLITGILSLISGARGQDINQAKDAAKLADPFMDQRAGYQDQLKGLMNDPSSYLKDPMFTAPLKLGGESLARQFGASGMGLSGNTDAALQDYGQASGHKYLMDQLQELNLLSGASSGSPATAGQLLSRGQDKQTNAIGGGVGGIAGLLPLLLSGLGIGGGGIGDVIKAITQGFGGGGGVNSVGGIRGNQSGGADLGGYGDLAPGGVGSVGGIGGDQSGGIDLGGYQGIDDWANINNLGQDNWDINFDLDKIGGFDDTIASMFNP